MEIGRATAVLGHRADVGPLTALGQWLSKCKQDNLPVRRAAVEERIRMWWRMVIVVFLI